VKNAQYVGKKTHQAKTMEDRLVKEIDKQQKKEKSTKN